MSVLTASDITLYYQDRCIFDNVNLQLSTKDKSCIVGINGSGKTTLFNILSKKALPDSGLVTLSKDAKLSYLMQEIPSLNSNLTLEEELLNNDFKNNLQEFEKRKIINPLYDGLGFKKSYLTRKCDEFSLGWQMRIALIKVLSCQADLLLLDEPTNYLDIECRVFLRDYLRKLDSGFLIVSHDKFFLDSICKTTYELLAGSLIKYSGNYSFFEESKQQRYAELIKEKEKRDKERKDILEFVDKFRYKPTKAKQVQERIKRLEKLDDIEIFDKTKHVNFSFPALNSPSILFECDNIIFSYDNKNNIINNFNFELKRGDRVAIIGKNGMGKTTLLKLFQNILKPTGGNVKISDKTIFNYYSQDAFYNLNENNTIYDEIKQNCNLDHTAIMNMLGSFLFSDQDVLKKISVLSGGEKARVAICKMLLSNSNLLILDEITNHLDINSKDILKQALKNYKGSICFVSHDIDFIKEIATKIIYLDENGQHVYLGDFSYFIYKTKDDVSLNQILFTNLSGDKDFINAKSTKQISGDATKNAHKENISKGEGRALFEEQKKQRNQINYFNRKRKQLEEKELELIQLISKKEEELNNPEIYNNAKKAKDCLSQIELLKQELEQVENEYFELISED